ncbi:putative Paraflagellar rod protein [Trypanosoma vivax]|nr:putative Paraflagellar rod protein [Trypanosoma vivax]
MLKDKMAQALEMFGPTEDALNQAGIEFVHPAEEVEDGNMNRRSKMVEYRAHLAKQEEVKIAAEREELKRSKMLQSQQHRGRTVQADHAVVTRLHVFVSHPRPMYNHDVVFESGSRFTSTP